MTRYESWLQIVLALALLAGSIASEAHDVVVPPWRGSVFSTYQDWRFSTSANPAAAEVVSNPYGTPSALITVGPYGSGWLNWIPGLGTMTGYWDLGSNGTIQMSVPIAPSAAEPSANWVSVQTTYFRDITEAPAATLPGAYKANTAAKVVENVSTGGQWVVEQTIWRHSSYPASVSAVITSDPMWGSVVDESVVDTCRVLTVSGVAAAMALPDGTMFELADAIVTRQFGDFFYVEDANRLNGIRVNCLPTNQAPGEGSVPYILGTIKTIDGERVIDEAVCYAHTTQPIPRALFLIWRSKVFGLKPTGLLVKISGRASVPSPSATEFTVDDGSGEPIRVQIYGLTAPQNGKIVTVSGVMGVDNSGLILRSNSTDRIASY